MRQEQAGVPPSPPHSINDDIHKRPKRKTTRKNDPAQDSADPQPSAQRTTQSSRNTRVSKRGQSARHPAQSMVSEAPEASDVSTQGETSAQSDTSAQPEPNTAMTGNPERETPAFPSTPPAYLDVPTSHTLDRGLDAHPVPTSLPSGDGMNAQPVPVSPHATSALTVPGLSTPRVPTPEDLIKWEEWIRSVSPTTPVWRHSPLYSSQHPSHLLQGSSPRVQAPSSRLKSRVEVLRSSSPASKTRLKSSPLSKTPQRLSPPIKSPLLSSTEMPAGSPPSVPPSIKAPPPVYNRPTNPDQPHSLVHFMVDACDANALAKRKAASGSEFDPNIPIALPTIMIPDILHFIAQHPFAHSSELKYITSRHPTAAKICNVLTDNILTVTVEPISHKRKRDEASKIIEDAQRVLIKPPPRTSRLRTAFIVASAKNKLDAVEEGKKEERAEKRAQDNANELYPFDPPPPKRIKRVPQLYDEQGNLTLGKFIEVEMDSDEEDTSTSTAAPLGRNANFPIKEDAPVTENPYVDNELPDTRGQPLQGLFSESQSHDQDQSETVPETPRGRGWGFTSFLPSAARTVQKFIPFSSQRVPATPVVSPQITGANSRTTDIAPVAPIAPPPNTGSDSHASDIVLVAPAVPLQQIRSNNQIPNVVPVKKQDQKIPEAQRAHTSSVAIGPEPQHEQANSSAELRIDPEIKNTAGGLAKRNHKPKPRTQLKTKGEAEELKKLKEEKEYYRAMVKMLKEQEARRKKEIEKVLENPEEWIARRKAEEAARKKNQVAERNETRSSSTEEHDRQADVTEAADVAQTPGTKRKRSPDVIPNPPGCSYGMDPDYFVVDSDEDELDQDTPTKARPTKKTRLSNDTSKSIGDPHRAQSYKGTRFTGPKTSPSSPSDIGNLFNAQSSAGKAATQKAAADAEAAVTKPRATRTGDLSPKTPSHPGTFKVPSPTDSDESYDEEQDDQDSPIQGSATKAVSSPSYNTQTTPPSAKPAAIPNVFQSTQQKSIPGLSPPTSQAVPQPANRGGRTITDQTAPQSPAEPANQSTPLASKLSQPRPATNPASSSKPVIPPPRPNPSHASLPVSSVGPRSNAALEKARQKALMHQPSNPSRLRESSRLSTSTVGSDAGDDEEADANTSQNDPEYDPDIEGRYIPRYNPTRPALIQSDTTEQCIDPALTLQQPITSTTQQEQFDAYGEYAKSMSPKVKALLENTWDTVGDFISATLEFEADLMEYKEQKISGPSNANTTSLVTPNQSSQRSADSPIPSDRANAFMESSWQAEDSELAGRAFADDYEIFKAANDETLGAPGTESFEIQAIL